MSYTDKIYSEVEDGKLLHFVVRPDWLTQGRDDLINPSERMQIASLVLDETTTFKPHKHNKWSLPAIETPAQECWIVVRGSVLCTYYDLDDKIIGHRILRVGDLSCTIYGGHNYMILENGTVVYEVKTGPYQGQQQDKTFIN